MHLSTDDMAELIITGHAAPLLPDGVPGPVHYRGHWWAIPHGGIHYTPASTDQARQLDEHAYRLGLAAKRLQPATEEDPDP